MHVSELCLMGSTHVAFHACSCHSIQDICFIKCPPKSGCQRWLACSMACIILAQLPLSVPGLSHQLRSSQSCLSGIALEVRFVQLGPPNSWHIQTVV